jgi:formylmethanofuran dehydrogenase subunit E
MKRGFLFMILAAAAIGVSQGGNMVDWWDEVPPVTVVDAKDIGCTSTTGIETITARDVARYDGHFCPGLAQGFRACQVVFHRLFPGEIPARDDVFVVSGSKVGPIPSIEYLTGARYGPPMGGVLNGNLVYDPDIGRETFIFVRMSAGKAYKLTSKVGIPPDVMKPLHPKVASGTATPDERAEMFTYARDWAFKILTLPEDEIFEIVELKDYDWQAVKKKAWK